jgi:hypothetical protein
VGLINTLTGAKLEALPGYNAVVDALAFMPNLTVVKGTVLGQVSAANATETQTITYNAAPAAGTYTLSIVGTDGSTYTTAAITGLGLTAAALTITINALLASAGYVGCTAVVTGTTTTGAFTVTFAGRSLYYNMPLITSTVIDLTQANASAVTVTVAAGTAGVTKGLFGPYVGDKVATPAAPTVAWKGSAGYFPVDSTHVVCITHLTAQGESLPSPGKIMAKSSATDSLDVTPATLPDGVTGINIYVDGVLAATGAQTSATLVNVPGVVTSLALGALSGTPPPRVSTAFSNTDGRHIARAIAMTDFVTNSLGQVGECASGQQPLNGIYNPTAAAYFAGAFKTSELVTGSAVGVTADVVADLGARLAKGTITDGVLVIGG